MCTCADSRDGLSVAESYYGVRSPDYTAVNHTQHHIARAQKEDKTLKFSISKMLWGGKHKLNPLPENIYVHFLSPFPHQPRDTTTVRV